MSITNLIDFEEAFCLLGLYEQRYAQTGEFSYLTGGVEDDLLPVVFMPSEPVAENVLLTEDAPNEEELMSEQEESWQSHQEIPSEESEKILPTGNSEMEKPQTIFW